MSAVPKVVVPAPTGVAGAAPFVLPVLRRRVVAVAVSPMELLRPESDLARVLRGFPQVDLLVAADDLPVVAPGAVGVLGDTGDLPAFPAGDDGSDGDDAAPGAAIAGLGLTGLQVHRLGLRAPLSGLAEADLVAALSELVGFDPEPGVYCLAPAVVGAEPSRAVVSSAAQRIAQVYGLPLLRYRSLELCVVGESSS